MPAAVAPAMAVSLNSGWRGCVATAEAPDAIDVPDPRAVAHHASLTRPSLSRLSDRDGAASHASRVKAHASGDDTPWGWARLHVFRPLRGLTGDWALPEARQIAIPSR